jgi:DNA-binding NarL/FixJ family response regulator
LVDLNAMLSAASAKLDASENHDRADLLEAKRRLLADLCRLLGERINADATRAPGRDARALPTLSPRMRQTLDRLLAGDSEKQIANHMGLSRHTVHVYVKAIYKGFGVSSRGELLSKFVRAPVYRQ